MKTAIVTGLLNLLKVKSIITILLTVAFSILAVKGAVSADQFMTIFGVVIAFYFGTQAQKSADSSITTTTTKNTAK